MDSFYQEICKIACIAVLGVMLAGLFVLGVPGETEESKKCIIEYDDITLRSNYTVINTYIPNGTLNVTCDDAEKIAVEIDNEATKFFEGNMASVEIVTEPGTTHLVSVCTFDKAGKQLRWIQFELTCLQ